MTGQHSLRIAPIARADQAAALALLWPELDEAERTRRRETMFPTTAPLAPSTAALAAMKAWGGYRGEQLVAVMRVDLQPGRTATIAPPRTLDTEPTSTAQELLSAALVELAQRGLHILQALLPEGSAADAELLVGAGMAHLADLLYLVSLSPALAQATAADDLELIPYREQDRADWQRLIAQTYLGSLDCPGSEGLRSMDDVLEAYQAVGTFDPQRWLWARHAGRDVGCLLLADDPRQAQWEVTYLGVVPEARGRGWGLSLVRHAQWLTHRAGRRRLVLAVDAANAPALAIYDQAGFLHWDQRRIYLRTL